MYFVPTNLGLAIRVDEAWTLVDIIDADAQPSVTPAGRDYPFDSYQALPENWNGKTRVPD